MKRALVALDGKLPKERRGPQAAFLIAEARAPRLGGTAALTNPLRRNDLEARRRELGLSRVALGRILDVDPATVFRRERGPLVALWDYAMRGIEAEAASKEAKQDIRGHKGDLDLQTVIPDHFDARGLAYTAE